MSHIDLSTQHLIDFTFSLQQQDQRLSLLLALIIIHPEAIDTMYISLITPNPYTDFFNSYIIFRISNFNEEGGFSQVLHMDTPKSVVPGSESGNLLVVGGMGLNQLITKHNNGLGGLSKALVAVTPLLILHHFERNNVSLKENFLRELPLHVSVCKIHIH